MPSAASNGLDPDAFAKLMARFDTGNPSEPEAMNAGRALRRMLVASGLRLVDVMERADVKQALDDQLQPVRQDNAELIEARNEADELRQELTERIRQITQLADALSEAQANPLAGGGGSYDRGLLVNGGLVAVVTLAVIALLVASAFR